MTTIDYPNATAVVTGAASGIGAALCKGFADLGARVAVCDIDAEGAETVATSIGSSATAHQVDVADPDSVDRLADAVFADSGRVDVLCNNAGVFQGGLMWERSLDDYRWTFDVNCFGILHGVRSFVPRMIDQDTPAHIINTASVAAYVAGPMSSPYIVSKAAAFSITECLALDLQTVGSEIGVSVLTPSSFDTGIAHTAAVRQPRYGDDPSEEARGVADALASMTSEGLSPAAAVEPVLDGIRDDTFLIATKPSFRDQLRLRYDALLDQRLPEMAVID